MAVTIKPVFGLGTRVMKLNEWTAIDKCGTSGSSAAQQDTAKFKEVTFCNIHPNTPVVIHVGVFKRSSFTGSVITTELNTSGFGLMLQFNTEVPVGATFSLKDFYLDYLFLECEDAGAEPIVAVWVKSEKATETGYLDVIQRR
jgi:hypothetical protein